MEFHAEQLISSKKKPLDFLLILIILIITSIIWKESLIFARTIPTISAIIIVLSGWGMFKLLQCFNLEYEYELTNSYFDIDKIMGKARRKRVVSFDLKNCVMCAEVSAPEFKNTSGISKTYELSGNAKSRSRIFIDIEENGKKTRIIINPNEKIRDYLKKAFPRTVKF